MSDDGITGIEYWKGRAEDAEQALAEDCCSRCQPVEGGRPELPPQGNERGGRTAFGLYVDSLRWAIDYIDRRKPFKGNPGPTDPGLGDDDWNEWAAAHDLLKDAALASTQPQSNQALVGTWLAEKDRERLEQIAAWLEHQGGLRAGFEAAYLSKLASPTDVGEGGREPGAWGTTKSGLTFHCPGLESMSEESRAALEAVLDHTASLSPEELEEYARARRSVVDARSRRHTVDRVTGELNRGDK